MDKARIKALQKNVKEWKRYSEPPAKISRMVADQVVGWLNEYRAKNVDFLQKQIANVKTLRDVMAARSSFIDEGVVSRSSLKYAALPTGRLKAEIPKTYTEALTLAKELRARGAAIEADRAALKAEVLSQAYLYDQGFQDLLADTLAREGMFLAPSMLPTTPIEQITKSAVRQNLVGVIPVDDIVKEIVEGDLRTARAIMEMVDRDAGRSHLPQKLKDEYAEIGKLRVHTEPTLDDFTTGWDPERKAEFMEGLPREIVEKYKAPPATDMSRLPAEKADPAPEAAIANIARGIIADERAAIAKEITDLKGGST